MTIMQEVPDRQTGALPPRGLTRGPARPGPAGSRARRTARALSPVFFKYCCINNRHICGRGCQAGNGAVRDQYQPAAGAPADRPSLPGQAVKVSYLLLPVLAGSGAGPPALLLPGDHRAGWR
jgi:hypothetical protein